MKLFCIKLWKLKIRMAAFGFYPEMSIYCKKLNIENCEYKCRISNVLLSD